MLRGNNCIYCSLSRKTFTFFIVNGRMQCIPISSINDPTSEENKQINKVYSKRSSSAYWVSVAQDALVNIHADNYLKTKATFLWRNFAKAALKLKTSSTAPECCNIVTRFCRADDVTIGRGAGARVATSEGHSRAYSDVNRTGTTTC